MFDKQNMSNNGSYNGNCVNKNTFENIKKTDSSNKSSSSSSGSNNSSGNRNLQGNYQGSIGNMNSKYKKRSLSPSVYTPSTKR